MERRRYRDGERDGERYGERDTEIERDGERDARRERAGERERRRERKREITVMDDNAMSDNQTNLTIHVTEARVKRDVPQPLSLFCFFVHTRCHCNNIKVPN